MKYFIDTEFHEHQKPVKFLGITIAKVWTIDLISIGIVCEDGREYYACNNDLNLKHARKDKWLRENVLSKLPAKKAEYPNRGGNPRLFHESLAWKPLWLIQKEIIQFVGGDVILDDFGTYVQYKNNERPEFYAYYASYDWVVFCWIFGRMINLPNGFPMFPIDLKPMLDEKVAKLDLGIEKWNDDSSERTPEQRLQYVKTTAGWPIEKDGHNALADAKWNYELYKFITSYQHTL